MSQPDQERNFVTLVIGVGVGERRVSRWWDKNKKVVDVDRGGRGDETMHAVHGANLV